MVVEHHLDVSHDLSIAPVRFLGGLGDIVARCLEDARWLGIQHEGDGKQPLDPFWFLCVSLRIERTDDRNKAD